nr:unnamed protein product [Callosobruchus analis]
MASATHTLLTVRCACERYTPRIINPEILSFLPGKGWLPFCTPSPDGCFGRTNGCPFPKQSGGDGGSDIISERCRSLFCFIIP